MKATTHEGKVFDLRPGCAISGLRLVSIELTHTDFKDDRLYEWLREVVYVKMVPAPNDLPS